MYKHILLSRAFLLSAFTAILAALVELGVIWEEAGGQIPAGWVSTLGVLFGVLRAVTRTGVYVRRGAEAPPAEGPDA